MDRRPANKMLAVGAGLAVVGGVATLILYFDDLEEDSASFWGLPETISVAVLVFGLFVLVVAVLARNSPPR